MKINHVLVPLDQSDLSEAALDYAVQLVQPHGVIELLWVLSTEIVEAEAHIKPTPIIEGLQPKEVQKPVWERAERYLETVAERVRAPGREVNVNIAEGEPAQHILDTADRLGVDAIVMSTHGRSGLSRWVFGSVAQKVVSASIHPVFLVPQRSLKGVPI